MVFFGSLFGQQNDKSQNTIKPIAYSGFGANKQASNAINSMLFTQLEGQKLPTYDDQGAIPLPQYDSVVSNHGSIAKGINFFSVTKRQ